VARDRPACWTAGGYARPVSNPPPAGELTSLVAGVDRLVQALVESVDPSTEVAGEAHPDGAPGGWGPSAGDDPVAYRRWLADGESGEPAPPGTSASGAADLPVAGPLVTVAVRIDTPRPEYLEACLRSVVDQSYRTWELVPVGDGLADPAVIGVLDRFGQDPRLATTPGLRRPGPGGPEQDRRGTGTGAFVLTLGAEDALAPGALAHLVASLAAGDADVAYADEDGLDGAGRRCNPILKPDWDPELLLTYPYLGDPVMIRRSVLDALGIAVPVAPADRYDVELRVTEVVRGVSHVPRVLYHSRTPRVDADGLPVGAGVDDAAGHRALEGAAARRGIDGTVAPGARPGWYRLRRRIRGEPRVSVIIPFRDQAGLTRRCVDSLDRAPGHPIHEVVLVDNGSTEPETAVLRDLLEQRPGTRVTDAPGAFNWAAINNEAAAGCTGDLLLFLNNDIEARSDGWLRALVEQGQRPEVGAVGARLCYPDGSLQHAGIVLGIQGLAAHLLAGLPAGRSAYLGWDRPVRSWSAVTGACLLVRRQVFEESGGFDEGYPVAFNDVDFCLRLGAAGYRVVSTPQAELTHFESVSRGLSGYGADLQRFLARWGDAVRGDDPFYNPNLSRDHTWCGLRGPGEDAAWRATVDGLIPATAGDEPASGPGDEGGAGNGPAGTVAMTGAPDG